MYLLVLFSMHNLFLQNYALSSYSHVVWGLVNVDIRLKDWFSVIFWRNGSQKKQLIWYKVQDNCQSLVKANDYFMMVTASSCPNSPEFTSV